MPVISATTEARSEGYFRREWNLAVNPQRAVEAAPSSHLAYYALAQALFFRKEIPGLRNAVERAVVLNPMDGNALAFLGEMLVCSGDAERGLELAARAKLLNPSHPGWYWYVDVYSAYRQGDYRARAQVPIQGKFAGPLADAYVSNRCLWAVRRYRACKQSRVRVAPRTT